MSQQRPQIPPDMKEFNRKLVEEFRANDGQLSGQMAGRHLMLLTTNGARSGRPQTVVLGFRPAGDAYVVIASANGAPEDPAWYRNLLADPKATAEIPGKRLEVRARTTEGDERERMGALVEYLAPQQKLTERQIPVVVLEPLK
jgi:deazaflavin-dependent oxidoreductase (nitroreductase family)